MLKHFFTNSFGILTSRILGLFRDLLTAGLLGAGVWADLFFVAFKLPNLFRRLFGEGAFTQAFLPHYTAAVKKGEFAARTLLHFTSAMLVLSLLVMVFAPIFTKLLAWGWDSEKIALATPLVRINFWYLISIFCVTLLASILQYKGHFATTAFSTAALNISMIAALLISQNEPQNIIAIWLSFGVVVGGVLQVVVHIIAIYKLGLGRIFGAGFRRVFSGGKGGGGSVAISRVGSGENSENSGISAAPAGENNAPASTPSSQNAAKKPSFYRSFFAGVLGSSTAQLGDFITTIIASFLLTGAISYLYYANRIFQLPLALFAIALSTAIFPRIARQIKNGAASEAQRLLKRAFDLLFFLLLSSTIGGVVLADFIVKLLFERGAFSADDTQNAALVLQAFMLGLLPYGLYKLFSLWLYAHFMQKRAAQISFVTLLLNTALSLILGPLYGAAGLAAASSLAGVFLFLCVIKIYGFGAFWGLICSRWTLFSAAFAVILAIILIQFKEILNAYL